MLQQDQAIRQGDSGPDRGSGSSRKSRTPTMAVRSVRRPWSVYAAGTSKAHRGILATNARHNEPTTKCDGTVGQSARAGSNYCTRSHVFRNKAFGLGPVKAIDRIPRRTYTNTQFGGDLWIAQPLSPQVPDLLVTRHLLRAHFFRQAGSC